MEKKEFIEIIKGRTKNLAVKIILFYEDIVKTDTTMIMGKQLVRSVTSLAANYRAACLARSNREFYAKMSIVVEEADETLFWLELLQDTKKVSEQELQPLKAEVTEILKIVSTARKNTNIK